MQLVTIETADQLRRIHQRPWPVRRGASDLVECTSAIVGIGGDDHRDVVRRQPVGPARVRHDIKRRQFDAAAFEQEFDRRIAADVGGGRKRENAQMRRSRRARRPEKLMRRQDGLLDREPRLLVAEQLRDHRKIEPLARLDAVVKQPGRSAAATTGEDRVRPRRLSSVGQDRCAQRNVAGEFRFAVKVACPPQAASVASASGRLPNCEATSPRNTDGPTWSRRL